MHYQRYRHQPVRKNYRYCDRNYRSVRTKQTLERINEDIRETIKFTIKMNRQQARLIEEDVQRLAVELLEAVRVDIQRETGFSPHGPAEDIQWDEYPNDVY